LILLWGVPGDDPLDDVAQALGRRGAEIHLLDQRLVRDAEIALSQNRRGVGGRVSAIGGSLDLASVGAAYIRPQESSEHTAGADAALIAWADLTSAAVVNRPVAMASNNSKPFQLALIGRCSFEVPDTLVTTDPAEVVRFWRLHGGVVYKSVSGVRSIVSRLSEAQLERLADVANAPTQFQQHIPGVDVRAHIVGEQVLATMVRSDADDYRYTSGSGAGLDVAETVLPADIADRCRAVARAIGLGIAGIDLRLTPDGRWFCFEVNPSPAFTFYERATGQPIADAIAGLLVRLDHDRT
jgi:glutathione synthase/RimK-type ligase-like ATP-grasp enzyme